MRLRGVLSNLYGTLVNSIEDHLSASQTVPKGYGVNVEPSEYFLNEGSAVHEIAGNFSGKKIEKHSHEYKVIIRKKEDPFVRQYRFELYPGVEKILDELHVRNIPKGHVTAGLFDRITRTTPADFCPVSKHS